MYYESAQDISAVVTACKYNPVEDSNDDYDIYVSYSFEGNQYADVYWKSDRHSMDIGETVSVKVSSHDPGDPYASSPLGLSFSPLFHIGTIIFTYFSIIFL